MTIDAFALVERPDDGLIDRPDWSPPYYSNGFVEVPTARCAWDERPAPLLLDDGDG